MSRALVLDSLRRLSADGWPVTVREIMRDLGYASSQSIHHHLCNLIDEGLARKHPRQSKGGFLPAYVRGFPPPPKHPATPTFSR